MEQVRGNDSILHSTSEMRRQKGEEGTQRPAVHGELIMRTLAFVVLVKVSGIMTWRQVLVQVAISGVLYWPVRTPHAGPVNKERDSYGFLLRRELT